MLCKNITFKLFKICYYSNFSILAILKISLDSNFKFKNSIKLGWHFYMYKHTKIYVKVIKNN